MRKEFLDNTMQVYNIELIRAIIKEYNAKGKHLVSVGKSPITLTEKVLSMNYGHVF